MGPHYCFCSVQPHTLRHPVDIHRRSNLRRAAGRLSLRGRPLTSRYGIDMRISAPSTRVSNVFNGSLGKGASHLARLEVKLPEMLEARDNSTIKSPLQTRDHRDACTSHKSIVLSRKLS